MDYCTLNIIPSPLCLRIFRLASMDVGRGGGRRQYGVMGMNSTLHNIHNIHYIIYTLDPKGREIFSFTGIRTCTSGIWTCASKIRTDDSGIRTCATKSAIARSNRYTTRTISILRILCRYWQIYFQRIQGTFTDKANLDLLTRQLSPFIIAPAVPFSIHSTLLAIRTLLSRP